MTLPKPSGSERERNEEMWREFPDAPAPDPIPAPCDIEGLLAQVHERVGGLGLDITTFGSAGPLIEVRWRRAYPGEVWSDERTWAAEGLEGALRGVLAHEDYWDAQDAQEAVLAFEDGA
jgi:hypothetical protein